MKLNKWFASASSLAVVAGLGLIAAPASAAKPVIQAGPGSSVVCNISGKAKLAPKLANDWLASDHASDPGYNDHTALSGDALVTAAVAGLTNTTYSSLGPVTTSAKTKSLSCSGTVTDGTNTATIDSLSVSTVAIGSPPYTQSTCAGLAAPGSTAFVSHIKYKSATAKIIESDITSSLAVYGDANGLGFQLTQTGASGSFAGGSGNSIAYVDGGTIGAIGGGGSDGVTSANRNDGVTPATAPNPCNPTLQVKIKDAVGGAHPKPETVTAKLKKPKAFKQVLVTTGFFNPSANSNITLNG